jgi:CYTH domain-containing protein
VIERELRFLVNRSHLYDSLGRDVLHQGDEIWQGYLVADSTAAIRVRGRGNGTEVVWTLTVKAPMTASTQGESADVPVGSVRREVEIALTAGQAEELRGLCDDRIVTKSRSLIALTNSANGGQLWAEVDTFTGRWAGLVMVEVEFANSDQLRKFVPPGWFGREVTSDPRFTNAGLATASASVEEEIRVIIQAECGTAA